MRTTIIIMALAVAAAAGATAYEARQVDSARQQATQAKAVVATLNADRQRSAAGARGREASLKLRLVRAQSQAVAARAAAAQAKTKYEALLGQVDGNGDGAYDSHPGQTQYDATQPQEGDTIDGPELCAALRILNESEQTQESFDAYHACLGN